MPLVHSQGAAFGANDAERRRSLHDELLRRREGDRALQRDGPVKAALESAVRYLAYELGPKGIPVHAISSGPGKTRAASGIGHFDDLLEAAAQRAPARRLVSIEDIGMAAAVLATDCAKLVTGETVHVDGGYHIVG